MTTRRFADGLIELVSVLVFITIAAIPFLIFVGPLLILVCIARWLWLPGVG